VFVVKIGDRVIAEPVLAAVAGFVTVYLGSFVVLALLVTATGEDLLTAFAVTAACITNLGPALVGAAAVNVQHLNDAAVWFCSLAMLLGRLEVFTLLVLLTPAFWRE
jgi:trk system potassium uptake protein TrkH